MLKAELRAVLVVYFGAAMLWDQDSLRRARARSFQERPDHSNLVFED